MELYKIGQICDINPKTNIDIASDEQISFIPMNAVSVDGKMDTSKTISLDTIKNYTLFQNEDVLFAKITPCMENGKGAIARKLKNGYGAGSTEFIVLRPNQEIVIQEWLQLFLSQKTFRLRCQQNMTGSAGQKRVPPRFLANCNIPVPSLLKQRRIVAHIEELFSQLDASVNELKTAKERLKVYRQAVLNSCIGEGRFRPISECIISIGQGWSPKCTRVSVKDDNTWAVITTTAIQPMKFSFEENKKLPNDLAPREQHELKVGDILITRAGPRSRCGVCCMVRKTKDHLLNCDKVYCLKVKESVVLPEYLEAVLNAPDFQKKIEFCKTGGSDSGVNLTQNRFLSIEVPVPNIPTQSTILSNIETDLSICDNIENTVNESLQQAEALRQSILKKAFIGELL